MCYSRTLYIRLYCRNWCIYLIKKKILSLSWHLCFSCLSSSLSRTSPCNHKPKMSLAPYLSIRTLEFLEPGEELVNNDSVLSNGGFEIWEGSRRSELAEPGNGEDADLVEKASAAVGASGLVFRMLLSSGSAFRCFQRRWLRPWSV